MSADQFKFLNPKEAKLQQCKQRLNNFNKDIKAALQEKRNLQNAIKSVPLAFCRDLTP